MPDIPPAALAQITSQPATVIEGNDHPGAYVLRSSDKGKVLNYTGSGDMTWIVGPGLGLPFSCTIVQQNDDGQIELVAGSGVKLASFADGFATGGQDSSLSVIARGLDDLLVIPAASAGAVPAGSAGDVQGADGAGAFEATGFADRQTSPGTTTAVLVDQIDPLLPDFGMQVRGFSGGFLELGPLDADSGGGAILMNSFASGGNAGGNLFTQAAEGERGAPAAIEAGGRLFQIFTSGYDGAVYQTAMQFTVHATSNFADTVSSRIAMLNAAGKGWAISETDNHLDVDGSVDGGLSVDGDPSLTPIIGLLGSVTTAGHPGTLLTCTRAMRVTAIMARIDVASSGALTVAVVKAASGVNPVSSGTALASDSVDCHGTANTNQTLSLSDTPADLLLAAGDSIVLVPSTTGTVFGTITVWTTPVAS